MNLKNLVLSPKVVASALVAVAALAVALPVSAHYIYEYGFTQEGDYGCAWNRSEVSHGSGGGYARSTIHAKKVRVWTDDDGTHYDYCGQDFDRPIGHLRARYNFLVDFGDGWEHCTGSSYHYNSSTAARYSVYYDFGSTAPCGSGEYVTKAYGHYNNSGWEGGAMLAGAVGHDLPD